MTGIILQLFERTCVGKLTNFRASYCAQDDKLFDSEEGIYQ
jgi:hypothetical protein